MELGKSNGVGRDLWPYMTYGFQREKLNSLKFWKNRMKKKSEEKI